MTKKKKHPKKKRQQPRPKAKKKNQIIFGQENTSANLKNDFKKMGTRMLELLKDKDKIISAIQGNIETLETYFKKYDTVQLLGSTGLYLIDNLPNLEKFFLSEVSGQKLELDEDAEVIAEYALNFGLSMPNYGKETPSDEIVVDMRERLRYLSKMYGLIDMPLENNPERYVEWMIHSETIAVRGDGYQVHLQEVFKEMFLPHSAFYQQKYGFSIDDLIVFINDLENRIICKIGCQEQIYGVSKMWERWKLWDERMYGKADDKESLLKHDFSNGLFGDFFKANPDVPHTDAGQFLCYAPDDYKASDMIFWVYPQNETEKHILEVLSAKFGSNSSFIADGEFKGNIMNGHSIYEKPFVKDGERYYCFTPMIPHRNMFLIAEKLMMSDPNYYNTHFQQNVHIYSRDNYIERKVKSVLESFLPTVIFHSSLHYKIVDEGLEKSPELDILGISDKATYVIEVKAHELSHKDRVGIKGAKEKFLQSVGEACYQCCRAEKHIKKDNPSTFSNVLVDKSKPVYKIAVTFHHHSALLGNMDILIKSGLLKEEYRDTWIVSLFDLMVVADFFESEDEFIEYLKMHKVVYSNHSTFHDELDLVSGFLNDDLATKIQPNKPTLIIGGTELIDEEYTKDYRLPLEGLENFR